MGELSYKEIGYCEIPADFEYVAQAAGRLRDYCQIRGIDETIWPQIELIFCEGMNNAIKHGCKEDAQKIVKAKWLWASDELIIEIEDPGSCQAVSASRELPSDPLAESGRGEYLIGSVADDWRREPCDYGHRLVMKKQLHEQSCALAKMQDMFETLQAMTSELHLCYSQLDTLRGIADDLSRFPIIENVLSNGIQRMKAIVEIRFAGVWLLDKDNLRIAIQDGEELVALDFESVSKLSRHSLAEAFQNGQERIIDDCSTLEEGDPLYREEGSALICPISYQGDTTGIIAFQFEDVDLPFLRSEIKSLAYSLSVFFGIAHASATAFERSEAQKRSHTQLEIASDIQKSLMPSSFPNNEFCRATGRCVTAMEVGGDYIDAIEIKDYGLLIVIADVMGKGVPAALLATIFRTAIRSRLNFSETPGWLLSQINKQINEELGHLDMFITAQAAFLSYETRKLKLASGGHCPALLLRQGENPVESLTAEGIPLGIDPEHIYEERLIDLDTGDRLLFITDGLYESENRSGKMLGIGQLSDRLSDFWAEGVESVPDKALSYVEQFEEGNSASDDKTLMALEIR